MCCGIEGAILALLKQEHDREQMSPKEDVTDVKNKIHQGGLN